jgi:amidase
LAADQADNRLAKGVEVGPLHGVPFTVKENIDMLGSATTMGLPAFQGAIPERDSPHIELLKAAGGIPIARTNLPDLAFRWHTDSLLHGATINPWDASRSPGGSSGGEAVAVATGMTALGVGNDYFGSLRVPAQFCGIAALRPTTGRIASTSTLLRDPPISMQLMAVQGPMARHVEDLRLALGVMAGRNPRDPWWTPGPERPEPLPRRVAVQRDNVDAAVGSALDRAAAALVDAGYEVDDLPPPLLTEGSDLAQDLVAADSRVVVEQLRGALGADSLKFIDAWLQLRPPLSSAGVVESLTGRHRVARAWSEFQDDHPLILGPVSTRPPYSVGADLGGRAAVAEIFETLRLVVLVSLLGLPSVVVPIGEIGALPQAVQIIGPRFREDACLDAAAVVQHHVGPPSVIDPR